MCCNALSSGQQQFVLSSVVVQALRGREIKSQIATATIRTKPGYRRKPLR